MLHGTNVWTETGTYEYSTLALDGAHLLQALQRIRGTSNANLWAVGDDRAFYKTTPLIAGSGNAGRRLLATGTVLACSSSDSTQPTEAVEADANSDGSVETPDDASSSDATVFEAGRDADAGKPDATPLSVTCASPTCATSPVTTMGEGFCALLHRWNGGLLGTEQRGRARARGDDAGTLDGASPARVVGLSDVVALDHTCAVDKNGDAYCWGTGPFLRDGNPYTTTELTPLKLPIPPAKHVGVNRDTFSRWTACALVDAGILCWGSNYYGQIAIPDPAANPYGSVLPQTVAVPSGAAIRDLIVGTASFAIREDGSVLSWGGNRRSRECPRCSQIRI